METRTEVIKRMGDELREEILLEVNRRIQRSRRRTLWLRVSAIAASVALLVGIFSYVSYQAGYKDQNSQWIEMENPLGMRSTVVLSDGTKVILNAGTTLSYPSAFVTKQREVRVEGEAFFEVAPDVTHPFIVKAENVRVRVFGTRFNVKAYKEEKAIEVTLEEGVVGVGFNMNDLIRIRPGQQVRYEKKSHRFLMRDVRLRNYISWTRGNFYFENQTLEKIARQLERSFNVRITIEGEELKKTSFTGDFVRGENIEQILRVMTSNRPIHYEIGEEGITISRK